LERKNEVVQFFYHGLSSRARFTKVLNAIPIMNILSQVAIAVPQIAQAKELFELLTGRTASLPHHVASQKVNVSFIEMGSTKIELLEPAAEQTPITKFLQERGGGVHHLGLKTKRFEDLIAQIKQRGVRTLGEPSIGAEGHRVVFLHPKDTYGVLIEIEEA
jgi:methylmalonyl-CoA epimerase